MSTRLPLIARINLGDAGQYVQPPCLSRDVGVVVVLGEYDTRVIVAVLCCDLLQLIEELVQSSSSEPPVEQVADPLCWSETAVIEAAQAA